MLSFQEYLNESLNTHVTTTEHANDAAANTKMDDHKKAITNPDVGMTQVSSKTWPDGYREDRYKHSNGHTSLVTKEKKDDKFIVTHRHVLK